MKRLYEAAALQPLFEPLLGEEKAARQQLGQVLQGHRVSSTCPHAESPSAKSHVPVGLLLGRVSCGSWDISKGTES